LRYRTDDPNLQLVAIHYRFDEETKMKPAGIEAIVRAVFDAYRRRDRAALNEILADDFTFTSPYDDGIDKATYFERCWPASLEYIEKNDLERIVADGDEAFVRYRALTTDGKEFRNVECFTISEGKVRRVGVYFGASYRDGAFVKAPLA
jgi:ketosteroid isomerase-like protein